MKFNYSVDQVTTILKVTRRTVYNYLKCGELEAYKEGREWEKMRWRDRLRKKMKGH